MSSRQTAASRGAEPCGEIGERRGEPRAALVQDQRCRDARELGDARAPRWPSFGGRKPSKKNRSVGRPATVSAASAAEAPGTAVTACPASRAARTSLKPGSEISGVPASDTSATASPAASRCQELRPRRRGVVLVIGRQRRRDAVMVEQLAGDARVLAGDQVGGGQRFERPQRDVAQVADRGRDQMQAAGEPRRLDRLAGERCSAASGALSSSVMAATLAGVPRRVIRRVLEFVILFIWLTFNRQYAMVAGVDWR